MRNLTKAITAVSLLMPVSAFSLGIGDISLHSALNQNLDAEIALHLSVGEQVSDLQVKLAPPEKFDEAGVPWHYFLSKIKFETVEAKNGATVIKVTSKEVLREPFLDFLVEVSWDKGNIYREFTVLVDPPVAYTQPIIPVIKQPVKKVEKKQSNLTKKAVKAAVVDKGKVNKPSKAALAKKASVKVRANKPFNGKEYGPVAKNEALWNVAERANIHQGVTRAQMMMAIYQANPKAFYKNNINALKAGVILKIPEREALLKLTRKDAQKIFKKQTDEWSGLVSAKPKPLSTDKASPKKVTDSSSVQGKGKGASLELKAPTESAIKQAAVVASGEGIQNNQGVVPELEQTIVSLTEENSALQSKMRSLEEQLAAMENMLVLKDEETALGLNKQNELARAAEVAELEKTAALAAAEQKTEPATPVDVTPDVAEKEPVIEPPVSAEPAVEPVVSKPVIVEPEDEGFSGLAIGGLILSILGLVGWGLSRKRKKEEGEFDDDDSVFASASEIVLPDPLGDAESTSSSIDSATSLNTDGDVMDSSFLSEFTSSDFHTFDIDPGNDVDPVLEADVYLAYGRYQQAEELMRQAISDHPERDECKLKLLEIFHASDNQSAFEEYTIELEKTGKNKDQEFWAKVVEMGDELEVSASSSTVLHDEKIGETASFSIDSTDREIVPSSMEDEVKVDQGNNEEEEVEFDLSIFDEAESTLAEEDDLVEITATNSKESSDLELDEFDFDSVVTTSEKEREKILDKVEGMETVDFDLDSVETKVKVKGKTEALETVDFDLDSLELDSSGASSDASKKGSNDTNDFESFDFDSTSANDLDSGDFDLTEMDEMETKIDLAKAYIDMGDYDAARSIAQDAFDQGNEEQKKIAKSILDMLD